MDIQQLRQSLKLKWLSYYEQNRTWLVKMRVWGTYDGLRRPSSGFILATLSVLEAQFDEILGFILELNNNPDRIIAALGLNFNPDEELRSIKLEHSLTADQVQSESLQEEPCEDKLVPLVVTKYQSPTKALHSEQEQTEITLSYKPVVSFISKTGVARTHQPVPAIAVATKIAPQSSGRMPNSTKLPVGIIRQKPVRSPLGRLSSGTSLAMTNEVKSNGKALPSLATEISSNRKLVRSLEITTEVPVTAKTLPSLALATEISSTGKISSLIVAREAQSNGNGKIQSEISKDLSSSTNARSLASWVDEFCQGTGWNQEEAIAMPWELK
ncbi:DUF5331 domain-containing protein [Dendronalium sp. ChiSLP03b]|uniref:DUF5331 domain-containing protein n=1 Tax=Dendronalium sp. ChiSLP03b TaxID=3075381 RepID=UPI002AD1FB1A|nr:DUF5331 domain-containing protein [Dendronalium sp. ChiSLP03b]MDZ8207594.1 DUF5331 domain-containing protein [Dendronalium sp. ChiSLP03b]